MGAWDTYTDGWMEQEAREGMTRGGMNGSGTGRHGGMKGGREGRREDDTRRNSGDAFLHAWTEIVRMLARILGACKKKLNGSMDGSMGTEERKCKKCRAKRDKLEGDNLFCATTQTLTSTEFCSGWSQCALGDGGEYY